MSLDVYLEYGDRRAEIDGTIPIREDGQVKNITRKEWDERYPGIEPISYYEYSPSVYHANITHNLGKMASAAGIYKHLWRPDELGVENAGQLIEPLRVGLAALEGDPERFREFNPSNGWGNYDGLIRFVRNYLAACIQYQDATIYVSR